MSVIDIIDRLLYLADKRNRDHFEATRATEANGKRVVLLPPVAVAWEFPNYRNEVLRLTRKLLTEAKRLDLPTDSKRLDIEWENADQHRCFERWKRHLENLREMASEPTAVAPRTRRRKKSSPTRPTDRQKEIADAVTECQGDLDKAAKLLGISRQGVVKQFNVYIAKLEKHDPTTVKQFKELIKKPKAPRRQHLPQDRDGQITILQTDRRRRSKPIRD